MDRRWWSTTTKEQQRVPGAPMLYHSSQRKKIALQSLGCSRNLVDTEVMMGLTVATGNFQVTGDAQEDDYSVVNTYGSLEAARTESHEAIQTMSRRHVHNHQQTCQTHSLSGGTNDISNKDRMNDKRTHSYLL